MNRNRIDIYPLHELPLQITSVNEQLTLNPDLEKFVQESWNGKESWDNAWIPVVRDFGYIGDKQTDMHPTAISRFQINAGIMTYAQTHGILRAITENKPFAPSSGAIHNLSIGVIPVTSDGYVMLSRRSPDVSNAPGVWNFAGGYMSSRFLAKAEGKKASDPVYKTDPRVFDLSEQVRLRIQRQEFHGLTEADFTLEDRQAAIALGYKHSREAEIGWVAYFNMKRHELAKHVKDFEAHKGVEEHSRTDFLAVEDLDRLLMNQARLINVDPKFCDTKDPREAILLDDNIGELLGGAYKQLTGMSPYPYTIDYLRKNGWDIRVAPYTSEKHKVGLRI